MLPPEALSQLKAFVSLVQKTPYILNSPQLAFFKEFIESFGGVVPPGAQKQEPSAESTHQNVKNESTADIPVDEDVESDLEIDNTGVIEVADEVTVDNDPPIPTDEVSEESIDLANEKKREGISLYAEGNYEKAVETFSEAIKVHPGMALLYAKRGQCFLQLNKPNACIRDCTKALEINPDNASAYKFRGRAHRLLGHWLEAVKDLRSACKIDFDEQADEWLKEVTPNARKIEEHQRKYERIRAERELRQRQERVQKAREEHTKAASDTQSSCPKFGADAAAGGKGDFKIPPEFMDMFNDPEVRKCFEDPEVSAAFADISTNPGNLMKYASNPKIMALIMKLGSKLGGKGGFPGGFPGGGFPGGGFPGAGGFPGFGGGGSNPPPSGPKVPDDIGLD